MKRLFEYHSELETKSEPDFKFYVMAEDSVEADTNAANWFEANYGTNDKFHGRDRIIQCCRWSVEIAPAIEPEERRK
jgi:hypothetical protein